MALIPTAEEGDEEGVGQAQLSPEEAAARAAAAAARVAAVVAARLAATRGMATAAAGGGVRSSVALVRGSESAGRCPSCLSALSLYLPLLTCLYLGPSPSPPRLSVCLYAGVCIRVSFRGPCQPIRSPFSPSALRSLAS
jgi:hypothetical protein